MPSMCGTRHMIGQATSLKRRLYIQGCAPYGDTLMSTMSTERFVQRRNLELLRVRLTRTTDEAECQRIVNLIEEEEAKKPGR